MQLRTYCLLVIVPVSVMPNFQIAGKCKLSLISIFFLKSEERYPSKGYTVIITESSYLCSSDT